MLLVQRQSYGYAKEESCRQCSPEAVTSIQRHSYSDMCRVRLVAADAECALWKATAVHSSELRCWCQEERIGTVPGKSVLLDNAVVVATAAATVSLTTDTLGR